MDPMKHRVLNPGKLFIISDLHIGDGSLRDNLTKDNKALHFNRFLDEVERQCGTLMILGDLMELLRYPWTTVLGKWWRLFDRLSEMDVHYVPGNHDDLFDPRYEECRQAHPFFESLHHPFTASIGGKRFRFMHGHEIDPLINRSLSTLAPAIRFLAGTLERQADSCLITSDRASDWLLEAGEQVLRIWHTLTRQVNHTVYANLGFSSEPLTWLKRPIRTRNMLARYYKQQQSGLYDITITGHTHYAGHFDDWYFNCGCWTRQIMNYLTIDSDGRVEVRNWTSAGTEINTDLVA